MIQLPISEQFVRVFLSLIVGLLIGFTRRNYPAGLRTFTLICIGATIFTIISIDPVFNGGTGNVDPTRVISQIVTGIGFIGAGVIWKSNAKVSGLTTAAAIWVTASIGILVGMGEYFLSLFSLIIVMAVLLSKRFVPDL
jgi:putative Mg2+ transporter-C (MgtC) family protein